MFEFPKKKETTLDILVNTYVAINEKFLQKYLYLAAYLTIFE